MNIKKYKKFNFKEGAIHLALIGTNIKTPEDLDKYGSKYQIDERENQGFLSHHSLYTTTEKLWGTKTIEKFQKPITGSIIHNGIIQLYDSKRMRLFVVEIKNSQIHAVASVIA